MDAVSQESMKRHWIVCAAIALLLAGCASGSAIVTGNVRAPVDPHSVKIYTRPPAEFEEIAIVKAGSDAGWTQQESVNYALEELKKQAAKLGANGVVITSTGTQAGVVGTPVNGGGTIVVPTETEVV